MVIAQLDTRRVDYIQIGAVAGIDSGTRGTEYFDAFVSRRQTYIGMLNRGSVLLGMAAPETQQNLASPEAAQKNLAAPAAIQQPAQTDNPVPVANSPASGVAAAQHSQLITTTVVISYTYDPLNRLTAADYEGGMYFHYTYDAVGNRVQEVTNVQTNEYGYDDANRLVTYNGVNYAWDDNGNLLWDGKYNYTYDRANRLINVSGVGVAASYAYNGMGDRLSETANGQTTHYTMDLNAGLTQVLQDGTNTYLYGAGRVAQYGANGPDYYLGDALGSVRQMVDGSGNVTLGRNYKPYGGVLSSMGGGATSYGFTNEWTDASTGDVYLRARWYAPGQGRFLTKDTWEGDYSRPMSLNGWGYVEGNPIIRIDPSGYVSLHAEVVIRLAFTYILSPHYNIPSTIKPNPAYPGLRTGKWVDLADLGIREVYEVEPIDFGGKGYNPGHGVNQALDYVNLLNQGILPNEKLWTLGSRNLVDHWITWSGLVEVDTFTQAPGLVVFKATLSKKAQEICVDILITLLLTKGLIDIQGVSPRGPVPVTIPIT